MKLIFISDIHGSASYLEKVLQNYQEEGGDYLVILGDILYHGARNQLPEGHDPKRVIGLLNQLSQKIIAVRGNCDSEVDEMVLDFPIMASYNNLIYNNRRLFLTHGHIYNEDRMPQLEEGDLFAYGHTHISRAEKKDGIYFLNPGSISLPKEEEPKSYGVLAGNSFIVKDLEGRELKRVEID